MNRGIVVIVVAIAANLVLAAALANSTWSPVVIAAMVATVFATIALCWFYRQSVIDAAERGWNWCCANRTDIAKAALVLVLALTTLLWLWLLAVKAVKSAPSASFSPVSASAVAPAATAKAPVPAPSAGASRSGVARKVVFIRSSDEPKTITAAPGKWTVTYRFEGGGIADYRALNPNGRFKLRDQNGVEYSFTPEESDMVPAPLIEASFMALGSDPEELQLAVMR